jgi:ubiquinone/menaquinone biosynthesis C-methylase UbiE
MSLAPPFTAAEAAMYDSLVVPRYMEAFGMLAVPMLIPSFPAVIAHLPCRTGYPATLFAGHLPGCAVSGVDNAPAALELARTKAALVSGIATDYVHAEGLPTPLAGGQYTHSFGLHPMGIEGDYTGVFFEHHRLLMGGGQMVVSLPLRGSYPEIYDMLREYALRHDQPHFGESVDEAARRRPNPETLAQQIEHAGFTDVEVGVDLVAIAFENGRDFLNDPIARLVVGPDIRSSFKGGNGVEPGMNYATDAISKYWSEIPFELTVNIGSASARKPM